MMDVLGPINMMRKVGFAGFYYPLTNTENDPTYSVWQIVNAGYVFVPFDGIYTDAPITYMGHMLRLQPDFNDPDIAMWDTSSVTDMRNMFHGSTNFNQNIGSWDTSKVTDMREMFRSCSDFNQDLSGWCVSNFSEKPSGFDNSANSWTLPRPIWGTCP